MNLQACPINNTMKKTDAKNQSLGTVYQVLRLDAAILCKIFNSVFLSPC
jgi:hypothetical protein